MDKLLRSLAKVDLSVEAVKKYMGQNYIGHICIDCALEANKSMKVICGCKTNWKCEKHAGSDTELPTDKDQEYIIAKCAFRT